MIFPVGREKDLMFCRNPSASRSRNKTNKFKHELKDRHLNEDFNECPSCKKQELIEIAKPEKNKLFDFCLNCRYKKFKGKLTHE